MGLISGLVKTIGDWFTGDSTTNSEPSFSPKTNPQVLERTNTVKDSPLEILENLKSNPQRYEASLQQLGPRAALLRETLNDPTKLAKMQELLRKNQNPNFNILRQQDDIEKYEFDRSKFQSITFSKAGDLPRVIELKLKNGIKVLVAPDNSANQFSMKAVYNVGSKDDKIPGTAHFLEHLLAGKAPTKTFKTHETADIVEFNGGYFNAFTEKDLTAYDTALPTEFLELAFKLESERMMYSDLDAIKDTLPTEKSIIEAEIKRGNDDKAGVVNEELFRIYHKGTGYAEPIIGTVESVKSLNLETLKELYSKYKNPENLTLMVSGNIGDIARFEHLLLQYFAAIEASPVPASTVEPRNFRPENAKEKTRIITRAGEDKFLGLAYGVSNISQGDYPIIEILTNALTNGTNAILKKKLADQKNISCSMKVLPLFMRGPSFFNLIVGTDKFVDLDELQKEIQKIFKDISEHGIDEDVLNHIKQAYIAIKYHELENQKMKSFYLTIFDRKGNWQDYTSLVTRIQKITNDDIKRFVKKYFVDANPYSVQLKPSDDKPESKVDHSSQDFTMKHQANDPLRLKKLTDAICGKQMITVPHIAIQKSQDTKCTTLLHENHKLPTVEVSIISMREAKDLKEKMIRSVLLTMLNKGGTDKFNPDQISNLQKELGAGFGISINQESLSMHLTTTTVGDNLRKAAELFKEILLNARLNVETFTQAKENIKTMIKEENTEAESVLSTEFKKALYPDPKHIFYPGTREERWQLVDSISYEDVLRVWNELKTGDYIVGIAGDINDQQIKQYLTSTLNTFAQNNNIHADLNIAKAHKDDIQELDSEGFKGEQEQAHIKMGQECKINQVHPDYYALELAVNILGANSISSRLGRILRENKGLVYGLGAYLDLGIREGGKFGITASGKKANSEKLKTAIKEILAKFPDDITDAEIDYAKNSLINSFYIDDFEDNSSIASTLVDLEIKKRDMNFVKNFATMIKDISRDQIITAVKNHLDLNRLVEVIVDDKVKINGKEIDTKFNAKAYKAQNGHINKIAV